MTKSLKALCVLFFALILLSGCTSAKRSALKTDFSADFSAGYHGQKLCGNLTYNRQGRMNLRINSPETLEGLSVCDDTKQLVNSIIENCVKPLLIDADALNCIAQNPEILKSAKAEIIITPHPGEFARLINSTAAKVNANRENYARKFALKYGVVTVLKGAGTVTASPEGKLLVNRTGNSGMATGGSGDVLAGMAGSLLAQGTKPFEAAAAAVYLHGLAGDIAAERLGKISMLPSDMIECIPEALRRCGLS